MLIRRITSEPHFYKYVTEKALIPHNGSPSFLVNEVSEWVEIPQYQRGISWDGNLVEEFLDSTSILLGNVLLGRFINNNLNIPSDEYFVLIDGLQRFSVGTMILSILHQLVFSSNGTFHSSHSQYFTNLIRCVNNKSDIFLHNDAELSNHPRNAIAKQYKRLRKEVDVFIQEQLHSNDHAHFSDLIEKIFLKRQISIDLYYNFNSPVELMSTFLGINTVRVDLGPIDLVRARIIERGASSGWSPSEIENVENEFTSVFTSKEKPDSELLPFASVIDNVLQNSGSRIFPSWDTTQLLKSEVDEFLEFVHSFKITTTTNGYFKEIRECGSLPFAILLSYYYMQIVHNNLNRPDFLSGLNNLSENEELHRMLIACYRVLLDGRIGRTRIYVEKILEGTLTSSLSEIANIISIDFIQRAIDQHPDPLWLTASLNKVDRNRAKRVFNAILLPLKGNVYGRTSFEPLTFGRAASTFHIDHLIPISTLNTYAQGLEYGNSLRNYAPLPNSLRRNAKSKSCSSKLSANGVYSNYLSNTTHREHPFCKWLVNTHATQVTTVTDLDLPELLEPNQDPQIGTDRFECIHSYLLARL